jgi:2-C-methyl-D-erythritol 4-phosphate cytidylyltransferase
MKPVDKFIVIVPAAGVGKRMQANCPKQYLKINDKTILSHTLGKLLSHPRISQVILALSEDDQYFADSDFVNCRDVIRVKGGKERVDSVLNGLYAINADEDPWVLVHDAARPCLTHQDIDTLLETCLANHCGGLLATPVRDTMKRGFVIEPVLATEQADGLKSNSIESRRIKEGSVKGKSAPKSCLPNKVKKTVERSQLWHALTPQLYKTEELTFAIEQALTHSFSITDESSAIEQAGFSSLLVPGSSENIKITHPDDLALAEFYLSRQVNNRPIKE